MLTVSFKNAIVCDVVENEFEGKTYYSALVYLDRSLYRIGCSGANASRFKEAIAHRVSFDAVQNTFEGKVKFKFDDGSVLTVIDKK